MHHRTRWDVRICAAAREHPMAQSATCSFRLCKRWCFMSSMWKAVTRPASASACIIAQLAFDLSSRY